jgi:hypothetical protein
MLDPCLCCQHSVSPSPPKAQPCSSSSVSDFRVQDHEPPNSKTGVTASAAAGFGPAETEGRRQPSARHLGISGPAVVAPVQGSITPIQSLRLDRGYSGPAGEGAQTAQQPSRRHDRAGRELHPAERPGHRTGRGGRGARPTPRRALKDGPERREAAGPRPSR